MVHSKITIISNEKMRKTIKKDSINAQKLTKSTTFKSSLN